MSVTINISGVQIMDGLNAAVLKLKGPADEAALRAFADEFRPEKDYAAVLGEKRKKRSLDANSYAWVLLNQLSEKLRIPAEEIYRAMLRKIPGLSITLIMKDGAVEPFTKLWGKHGLGWQCGVVDKGCSLEGYSIIKCYKGSSEYTPSQMHLLLDTIVQDCRQYGIETRTPEEIDSLINLMESGKEKPC